MFGAKAGKVVGANNPIIVCSAQYLSGTPSLKFCRYLRTHSSGSRYLVSPFIKREEDTRAQCGSSEG